MRFRHVALVCRSEENADLFYGQVLGLKRTESRSLSRELARAVFEIDFESTMMYYVGEGAGERVHFEVFIDPHAAVQSRPVAHVSLEVDDMAAFLERCRLANVTVRRIPRGEGYLTFVLDPDFNLFEIKEAKQE